jgi:general secretion pathway protein E
LGIRIGSLKSTELIGQVFLQRGLIDDEELRTALNLQAESREKLGKMLVDLGYVSERDCLSVVSEHIQTPAIMAADYPKVPVLDSSLSFRFMKQCKFVPVALEGDMLALAMTDPLDSATLDSVRQATGIQTRALLGAESEIMDALERFYGSSAGAMGRIIEGIGHDEIENISDEIEDIEQLKDLASEAPVIRLVNLLISKAIESHASDIHIEPFEKDL